MSARDRSCWKGACLAFVALATAGCVEVAPPPAGAAGRAIVNGEPDTVHPAVVALIYGDAVFCTGTVIAPRAVLTAGHCLARGGRVPELVQVFFGDDRAAGGQQIAVTAGVVHREYYMNDARGAPMNDVAVLTLAEDAPVAPLPWQQAPLPELEGESVTLVGYGITAPGTGDGLGVRRQVAQTIIALDGTFYYYTGSDDGTCQGDSGGPMLLDTGGVPVVVGVTSFGDESCVGFGANTRTDRFAAFIAEHAGAAVAAPTQPIALRFVTPGDGATVGGTFTVAVEARSRSGIAAVAIEVDGEPRASRELEPWELGLYALSAGEHQIVARAVGADDGVATATLAVTVTASGLPPGADDGDAGGGCGVGRGRAPRPAAGVVGLLLVVALGGGRRRG